MNRLVLDIGNTKTAVGLFRDGELVTQWRITTSHWTCDDLWVVIGTLLGTGAEPPDAAAFASVVPQVRHSVRALCSRYFSIEPLEVTTETAGIGIGYRFPHELGADRLANAVGATALGKLPCIIVDFGTATTFDVVNADGDYVGGAIAPGVGTAAGELFKKAERLNPVDLVFPRSPLGRDTSEAVRSGVLLGAVGATDHLVDLLAEELGGSPALWATGGWAPGIASRCRNDLRICPELTLIGIDRIGERAGRNG